MTAADSIVGGHLVVIGASASGVEALSALVTTIPLDFPAPIVVAQHLDPRRPSHLGEILSPRSTLPVATVDDRAELKPGWIHVVPANRHVEVTDHEVRLTEPSGDTVPVPSIDFVLSSAAEAFGEALVAVILTGTGSDGAEGARTVKDAGGTVVIQDPETARYPSMPASLAPTTVDIAAPVESIGQILHDLVTGVLRPDDDAQVLDRFLDQVRKRNEELETLNEELQATNEELETLNEELQATIEELNTTNDELQARGAELQEMASDLEEQRRDADAARARVAAVIESINEAVLVVDDRGQTVVRNETFRRLFDSDGLELRDADGERVTLTSVRTRAVAGEIIQSTFSNADDSGRRRWFELHAGPVPAEMEIGAGAIVVVRDTTDISVRRPKEEFIGVVAHELRTPLTALRGYLQMLSRRGMDADSLPKLGLAIEQADRLHHLVDELFDMTRADTGRLQIIPEPIDLRSVIADTVEIARGLSDRHRFRVEQPDTPLLVVADPNRIRQVLLNLLTNSVIHAPDAPDVSIRLRSLRRRAEIEIQDRGPGISPDVQQRLFMRFERGDGRGQGLGLGLYISRHIVHAHGGTLEIDSAPGDGATFTIRLPLAPTDGAVQRDTTDGARSAGVPAIGARIRG